MKGRRRGPSLLIIALLFSISFSEAIKMRGEEVPPDDDVMAYSNLIADGMSLNKIDKVMKKKEKKEANAKIDESTATLEYSLMQAGNENESEKYR